MVIQKHSRKLLMMYILMSETCWAHKKWNKIASDIKLVFHSSAISMYSFHQAHGGCYHRNNVEARPNRKSFEVLTAVHTRIILLGCNAFWFGKSVPAVWRDLESSSAWKTWAVASPKILAHVYQTVWQRIPEYPVLDSVLPFRKIRILCRHNENGLSVMDQLLM